MSLGSKQEKSLLSHAWELVSATHYPELAGLSTQDLQTARKRLCEWHSKAQGFARHK